AGQRRTSSWQRVHRWWVSLKRPLGGTKNPVADRQSVGHRGGRVCQVVRILHERLNVDLCELRLVRSRGAARKPRDRENADHCHTEEEGYLSHDPFPISLLFHAPSDGDL